MFQIQKGEDGSIVMIGRLDASQAATAQEMLDTVTGPQTLDLQGLDYVSSAGLAVLLKTQKRLMPSGGGLKLINVGPHIWDILRYSGFDKVFSIEARTDG